MSDKHDFPGAPRAEKNNFNLDYFIRLHNMNTSHAPCHSAEMWDQRADEWEKDYADPEKMKSDDRIQMTVGYLKGRGLLGPDCDVADIGCGPGRFAAAFARSAHHVTGFDISEKMIAHGSAYVKRERLENVSFQVCDFQALDIEKENLAGKFDLVFSSITPAGHGMNGLEKMMRMSRKYCCEITHIHSENELESRIMRELLGRERPMLRASHWFYSLFNVLFLTGYYPEATYYKRHQERNIRPDAERVRWFAENLLPAHERTRENEERILDRMMEYADADGSITEVSDTCYGRLLWDIREKTSRPAYAAPARGGGGIVHNLTLPI